MRRHGRWLTVLTASGLVAVLGNGLRGGQADEPNRPTAADVMKTWEPNLEGAKDYQQRGASLAAPLGVAGCTFRVVGPSFEALWNRYAALCGTEYRYEARRLVTAGARGPKGSYIVADRESSDVKGDRGLSLFVLRTERYTVTATIQPDPDGRSVRGSISAVVP
jgi:hypothetical protein